MSDQSNGQNEVPKYGGPRDRRNGRHRASDARASGWSAIGGPRRRSRGPSGSSSGHDARRARRYGSASHHPEKRHGQDWSGRSGDGSANTRERPEWSGGAREQSSSHAGTDTGTRPGTESRGPAPGRPDRAPPFDVPVDDDLLEAFAVLDFETDAQRRVYRYVERRGVASDDEVHAAIDLPTEDLALATQWLVQHDYLDASDGTLRVTRETDVEKTYAMGDFDVTIRPAGQEDLGDLVELIRVVTDDRTYVVAESVAAQLAAERTVIRDTEPRSRLFFVATVDDGRPGDPPLVGWVHLTLPGVEYLDHAAELTVGVRPDFRRCGIGSRLVRVALAWAAASGYRKVYQSLPGTNRTAIDFLRNHGWVVEAVRPDHYRIDGQFVDEVMMAVRL